MEKTIILASNNMSKLKEMKEKILPFGISVISKDEAGFNIEVEETGTTFKENAELKAEAIYKLCKKPVIADDSGLEIDYLNGEPGVYSARFAGENATNQDRINKVLKLMKDAQDKSLRTARFKSVICYIDENGMKHFFEGICEGIITKEPRGEGNFGYDPIFEYKDKTFAEITLEEKNKVSHRGLAVKKLLDYLKLKNKI